MKRFILLLIIVFIGYVSKPLWEEPVQQAIPSSVKDSIRSAVDFGKEYAADNFTLDNLTQQLDSLFKSPDNLPPGSKGTDIETPKLSAPEDHLFSIHNIELGQSKAKVEQKIGKPKRTSKNEYGVSWAAYHENYHNFIMVAYDKNNMVRGLFTNQDLIASAKGVKLGSSKQSVRDHLGTPESAIRKGLVNYQINSNGEYDVFRLDNSFVTVFYDKHANNTVTAIQIINKDLEQNKDGFYTEPSKSLREGFEYQLFDLTNATRVKHGLSILKWDDHVSETARNHSLDMAENQYFAHTNPQGQSPFDRMKEDNISFITAGENLAYGQFSSIFAHEGLMNSLGHRKNILRENYKYLGVGVAFNNESQPYYTEDFYSNSPSL
ncbi:CAP domain-containing protein [Virgibacillus phasianinus]|uniref:CAP domain-containing protein n=1 Tax=Virgibacillus phasianinus TaxID=2017483 RepID=UPI001560A5D2|nr:CAP domain-containing protein [Virgibacillus phasianinus]